MSTVSSMSPLFDDAVKELGPDGFLRRARRLSRDAFAQTMEPVQAEEIGHRAYSLSVDDFYIVWLSKTLQNWKALVSTDVLSGVYIEVTHIVGQSETYVDIYQKKHSRAISD